MTKEYYAAHSDQIKETAKRWTKNQRRKLKDFVVNTKSDAVCPECNKSYPWFCMTFGNSAIPAMVRKGVSILTLAKALRGKEPVCANCRRIRNCNEGHLTDLESLA